MRIVIVTDDQFQRPWNILSPVHRTSLEMPAANLYLGGMSTLVIPASSANVVPFEEDLDMTLTNLTEAVYEARMK